MHKEYAILPIDRQWLDQRVDELEKIIQELGPDFYDVFNQSSETWHDNAPFDALRDKQSVLFAELTNLKRVRHANTIAIPTPKTGTVGIGSTVTLDDRKILIAGHWTPHAGKRRDGVMIVSAESPIAKALLGKRVGHLSQYGTIAGIE